MPTQEAFSNDSKSFLGRLADKASENSTKTAKAQERYEEVSKVLKLVESSVKNYRGLSQERLRNGDTSLRQTVEKRISQITDNSKLHTDNPKENLRRIKDAWSFHPLGVELSWYNQEIAEKEIIQSLMLDNVDILPDAVKNTETEVYSAAIREFKHTRSNDPASQSALTLTHEELINDWNNPIKNDIRAFIETACSTRFRDTITKRLNLSTDYINERLPERSPMGAQVLTSRHPNAPTHLRITVGTSYPFDKVRSKSLKIPCFPFQHNGKVYSALEAGEEGEIENTAKRLMKDLARSIRSLPTSEGLSEDMIQHVAGSDLSTIAKSVDDDPALLETAHRSRLIERYRFMPTPEADLAESLTLRLIWNAYDNGAGHFFSRDIVKPDDTLLDTSRYLV
ncbi:uncharacterized protein L199_006614 [Kwoniella botswanensis]|uniref:uncharacterized protein n=1 Tax=Kwoniella botswanensis TaxID=1268659 RepID=UPI00315CC231